MVSIKSRSNLFQGLLPAGGGGRLSGLPLAFLAVVVIGCGGRGKPGEAGITASISPEEDSVYLACVKPVGKPVCPDPEPPAPPK